jgi:hypothetical protein
MAEYVHLGGELYLLYCCYLMVLYILRVRSGDRDATYRLGEDHGGGDAGARAGRLDDQPEETDGVSRPDKAPRTAGIYPREPQSVGQDGKYMKPTCWRSASQLTAALYSMRIGFRQVANKKDSSDRSDLRDYIL